MGIEMIEQESILDREERLAPVVNLHRIHAIETYELMESDIQGYCEATRRSETAFGFLTGCGGAAISCGAAWLTVPQDNPVVMATFAAVTIVLVLATLWFGATWWRERRKIPDLLAKVKSRTIQ